MTLTDSLKYFTRSHIAYLQDNVLLTLLTQDAFLFDYCDFGDMKKLFVYHDQIHFGVDLWDQILGHYNGIVIYSSYKDFL